jgi:hypothetical protein
VDTKHRNKYADTTGRQSSNFLSYLGAYRWIPSCPRIYTGSKVKPDGYTYTHNTETSRLDRRKPMPVLPTHVGRMLWVRVQAMKGCRDPSKIVCEEGRILEVNLCCNSTGEAENSSVGGVGDQAPAVAYRKEGHAHQCVFLKNVLDIWHTKNLPEIGKLLVNWQARLRFWHVVWLGKKKITRQLTC